MVDESNTAPVNEQEQPKDDVIPVVSVGIIKGKNELAVSGMLGNPDLCIQCLADAIKIINNMGRPVAQQGGIITPKKPDGIIVPK